MCFPNFQYKTVREINPFMKDEMTCSYAIVLAACRLEKRDTVECQESWILMHLFMCLAGHLVTVSEVASVN